MRPLFRAPVLAATPALLLLFAPVLARAGVERVENSRFERVFGPVGEEGPSAFGRHIDDEARSIAPRQRDEPAAVRSAGRTALAVLRPLGESRGIAWSSAPVQVASGRSYLLVIGWQPLAGQGEVALLVRGLDGRVLTDSSLRLTLLPDGHALSGPFAPGAPGEPWLFPPRRAPAVPVECVREGESYEARVRIGPLEGGAHLAEIELGHGPESHRALFVRASLLDLSEGSTAVRALSLGAAVVAAPAGVLLDPLAPPLTAPASDAVALEAAPGESRSAALLLSRASGAIEIRATELRREGRNTRAEDPAEAAFLRPADISIERVFSPRLSAIDTLIAADDRRGEASSLRLTVSVPDGTPAGVYRGSARLHPQSGSAGEVPLVVTVRGVSVTGNLIANPGFELARQGRPETWSVSGGEGALEPSDPGRARSGRRSLRLAHAPLEAVFSEAESAALLPARDAPHLLTVMLEPEGDAGPAEIELEGVGHARLAVHGDPPHRTLRLASSSGFRETLLEPPGPGTDGWLRFTAIAELGGVAQTRLRIRSDPAPTLGASALRVDDVALVPRPRQFDETLRFETVIANGGFERARAGEPLEPEDWGVAAEGASAGERALAADDLLIDAPVGSGERALRIAAGAGAPGAGMEIRSRRFPVARGDRLEASFALRPSGTGARLTVALRCFDREGRATPWSPGAEIHTGSGTLEAVPGGARIELGKAGPEGFHPVRLRVLDLPDGAASAVLAFSAPGAAEEGGYMVIDEARVAPVRTRFFGAGLALDGLARWYSLRLWDDDTDRVFEALFEELAALGIKPDSATPESFLDYARPFPSLGPPLLSAAAAQREAQWAGWWWRRGLPAGALAPFGEDLPRALQAFYELWMPPLRERSLAALAWAPVPRPATLLGAAGAVPGGGCIETARDMKLEGFVSAVSSFAPELRRMGRPCLTLDVRERGLLAGMLDAWIVPAEDYSGEPTGPGALHERRERGELLLADLAPDLARLDAAPARPRAALWRAWLLGFDGFVGEGLARWADLPGAGSGVDGTIRVDPRLRAAPGALLWPGPKRVAELSLRLLELGQGLGDLRLLRALEEAIAEAQSLALDPLPPEVPGGELAGATDAAIEALRAARAIAARPAAEAGTSELEGARSRVLLSLERLWPVVEGARSWRAVAATPPSRR